MLASWNVRGLNKVGKLREISSRLVELQPEIMILLETRVKQNKAKKIINLDSMEIIWTTMLITLMVEYGCTGILIKWMFALSKVLINYFIAVCLI